MSAFEGVIPILATPFHDDESVDLDSWQRMLEFMGEIGVDGVTILGVLGESNRLNDHEREALIRRAVESVGGRLPIIVGASHAGTTAARYLSQMAQDLGADGVMVMPAKDVVPDDNRIVELYQRLADGLKIPIVLQDHPASSEVHFPVALMLRLVREVPAIQCIKEEAVPTAPKIRLVREGFRERSVPILSGLGALYAPFDLEAGSAGFNTGFAFPEVLVTMVDASRAGDWDRVYDVYARFAPLLVYEQQPGVAFRKELLRRRGLIASARARHPGATISPHGARQIDELLTRTLPGVDIMKKISVDVGQRAASAVSVH
jgi:4-hydroxy-tetrahydrodipicolinate synthase